jgi:hypothetical protein
MIEAPEGGSMNIGEGTNLVVARSPQETMHIP